MRLILRIAAVCSFCSCPMVGSAGIITTSPGTVFANTPVGTWRYSEGGTSYGTDITYYPMALADYAGAVFQGYVRPDPVLSAITGGDYWFGNGTERFEVFSTYLKSSIAQTIVVTLAGDDGHSLFVDDVRLGGGGFGAIIDQPIVFQAGETHKIEIAGYNAVADWAFLLGVYKPDRNLAVNPIANGVLENIPGIELNANGSFTSGTVPEPSSLTIYSLGSLCFVLVAIRKRNQNCQKSCCRP